MSQTIHKFPIVVGGPTHLTLPDCAQFLSAQFQRDALCLWVLLDPATRCDCESCTAMRTYAYSLTCCPKKLSHGAGCCCGFSTAGAPLEERETAPTGPEWCVMEAVGDRYLKCTTHGVAFARDSEPPESCSETNWITPKAKARRDAGLDRPEPAPTPLAADEYRFLVLHDPVCHRVREMARQEFSEDLDEARFDADCQRASVAALESQASLSARALDAARKLLDAHYPHELSCKTVCDRGEGCDCSMTARLAELRSALSALDTTTPPKE